MWHRVAQTELISLCPDSQPFDAIGDAVTRSVASSLTAVRAVEVAHFSFCTMPARGWVYVSCLVVHSSSIGPYTAYFCTVSSKSIPHCCPPPPHFSAHLPCKQPSSPNSDTASSWHLSCPPGQTAPSPPLSLPFCRFPLYGTCLTTLELMCPSDSTVELRQQEWGQQERS